MKVVWISLLSSLIIISSKAIAVDFLYIEKDGDSHILYKASCRGSGSNAKCDLTAIIVSGKNASLSCNVMVDPLFVDSAAQSPSPETFIMTSTAGLCENTNTYVFSPEGMSQTKTSPAKLPRGSEKFCEKFPPKIYRAEKVQGSSFRDVPFAGCSAMSVKID